MSQARTNARRRRQAVNGFAHMSGDVRRPHYSSGASRSVADAIAAERRPALLEARRSAGSKKKKG